MTEGHIAIIGGTGFESLPPEIYSESIEVETRFGVIQVESVSDNYIEPYKLYFLSRHGSNHQIAPHRIDYRANIAALVELGVESVYAGNAVGSLRLDLAPRTLVLFDDFIDLTRTRQTTWFAEGSQWKHVDFSVPYSPTLRESVTRAAAGLDIPIVERVTYLCVDGPRFESPAEIRMYAELGGDVIGMTGLPEATMAREAGLEYVGVGLITNYGAGLTPEPVDHEEVTRLMQEMLPTLRLLLWESARSLISSQ